MRNNGHLSGLWISGLNHKDFAHDAPPRILCCNHVSRAFAGLLIAWDLVSPLGPFSTQLRHTATPTQSPFTTMIESNVCLANSSSLVGSNSGICSLVVSYQHWKTAAFLQLIVPDGGEHGGHSQQNTDQQLNNGGTYWGRWALDKLESLPIKQKHTSICDEFNDVFTDSGVFFQTLILHQQLTAGGSGQMAAIKDRSSSIELAPACQHSSAANNSRRCLVFF